MDKSFKKLLYPRDRAEQWKNGGLKDEFIPRQVDVERFNRIILSLLKYRDSNLIKGYSSDFNKFVRAIYLENPSMVNDISWIKDLKFDLVKGSIYKIKKYFLENSYLKDIRGGSMIIDRLNKEEVKSILVQNNLSNDNIIYAGGGNVFLAVPEGMGKRICRAFEDRYSEVALSVMNVFESVGTCLYDFAFDYKNVSRIVSEKLIDRQKIKIYLTQFEGNDQDVFKSLGINQKDIQINTENKVCSLCDIRDARYVIAENGKKIYACSSCVRKHKYGQNKSKFIEEYKSIIGNKSSSIKSIGSIVELGDEIAVIYGDGNNMGSIVMNIENIFEMMYFSDNLDYITKHAVYKSIYETMKEKAKFEVIALGGDDIFIIVPAEYCFDISSKIIDKFDKAFTGDSNTATITMSIGVVISKSSTPIASLFNIAQERLKEAKKITRKENVREGSIDIVELSGNTHINSSHNREFPMTNSRFKYMIEEFRNNRINSSKLYKLSYAQKNMIEKEFNLFYYYKESRDINGTNSIDQKIKRIYKNDAPEKRSNPYKINWDDLILINKRA